MTRTLITLALASLPALAAAHVSLVQAQAAAGSAYTATLRIGHGCEGTPTHTVVVHVPAGLRGAKPQPKPGWTLAVRKAPLAQPYDSHGRRIDRTPPAPVMDVAILDGVGGRLQRAPVTTGDGDRGAEALGVDLGAELRAAGRAGWEPRVGRVRV